MFSAVNASTRLRALAIAFTLAFTPLQGQQPPAIRVTVLDPLGAVVTHASVDLIAGGKTIATPAALTEGTFVLALPRSGQYAVRVAAPGFQTTTSAPAYFTADASLRITLATQTRTDQVTVTANGVPTPEAQVGVAVTVLPFDEYKTEPEAQDPLRLVPGLQVTQTGQLGGSTALHIRGGDSDANKVLLDGVPVSQIGGLTEFANLASTAISSIEILHEPNSAIYGSDAMAGVVRLTSTRATAAPLPTFTYQGDAGNFHTYRNEVTAGETYRQFDLFSAFSRMDTRNNQVNDEFHNATYAGNFGFAFNPANDLRLTLRKVWNSVGSPNAIALYGIADDGQQKEQDNYYAVAYNSQTAPQWHNQVRYAGQRLDAQSNEFGATGLSDSLPQFANTYSYRNGYYNGLPATLKGANGYQTSGTAIFQYSNTPSFYLAHTSRNLGYLESDYRLTSHLTALGAIQYKREQGYNHDLGTPISAVTIDTASYTVELTGDVLKRLFVNAGAGLESNSLYGFFATPRASVAYYLFAPSANGLFTGTKLHGSFGKGVKEPSIYQQQNSLYTDFQLGAPQQIARLHIPKMGPEYSRTYDAGLEQQLLNGRVRLGLTYFHNEFTSKVEYVSTFAVFDLLGIAPTAANLAAFPAYFYGAYLNSGAFQAQGLEFESEAKLTERLFARAGYTYTDAKVQQSFDCDNDTLAGDYCGPSQNTSSNFSGIFIGAYNPLTGARPFRVAPHTGYFALHYTQPKWFASLTGTLVGKRDDSTFQGGNDVNYGNSLLLPNRNLLGGYERLDLGGGYSLTTRVNLYANVQNLLSEHYFEAYGYPSLPLAFRLGLKVSFGGEFWGLK